MVNMIIDQNIFYALIVIVIVTSFIAFAAITLILSIPEVAIFMKAKIYKRPIIQIHTALKQTRLYAPSLKGEKLKYNIYDIPEHGAKFTPLPQMVEHVGASRHINYYSKAALGLDSKVIAAFRDVEKLLKMKGIKPTTSILDIIITMTDEEVKDLYNIDAESIENIPITLTPNDILEIRDTLQRRFIEDGQFVWETARNFVFLMQTETARSLDESIAIAREQAIEDARLGAQDRGTQMMVIYVVLIGFVAVICYKMLMG